jgi:hypothetical protein
LQNPCHWQQCSTSSVPARVGPVNVRREVSQIHFATTEIVQSSPVYHSIVPFKKKSLVYCHRLQRHRALLSNSRCPCCSYLVHSVSTCILFHAAYAGAQRFKDLGGEGKEILEDPVFLSSQRPSFSLCHVYFSNSMQAAPNHILSKLTTP